MRNKYTKETLEELVKNSTSVLEIIRKLGLKESGGTHTHITKRIKDFNIDISHFLGKASNHGKSHKGGCKKLEWQECLVLREKGVRQKSFILRRALIDSGEEYKCNECGIKDWLGKNLVLHVDHKNGNWLDDRKENIRFLCPNCHSQSSNYCGSKGYTGLTDWKKGWKVRREKKRSPVSEWYTSQSTD